MKIYVTSRFLGLENKNDIEALCLAVRNSGFEDFSFVRDVENYSKTFDDPKELWKRALKEIKNCGALLIDVSDSPSGGRLIEMGIAYSLSLPIIVIVKQGTPYKKLFDGISIQVICYENYNDIASPLSLLLNELAH